MWADWRTDKHKWRAYRRFLRLCNVPKFAYVWLYHQKFY
jgi:hypothetical protein